MILSTGILLKMGSYDPFVQMTLFLGFDYCTYLARLYNRKTFKINKDKTCLNSCNQVNLIRLIFIAARKAWPLDERARPLMKL